MGGGASVETAQKYELVPETSVAEDIKAYYEKAAVLKQRVADEDTEFYQKECKHVFKAHKDIIKTFTARSKSQLYLVDDEKVRADIGRESSYGTFIKCLMTPPSQTCAIMVDTATSGIGCDEMLVIRVLCTCASAQYFNIELALKLMKGNSFDLQRFVAKKMSKDPHLKILFQYLLADLNTGRSNCKRTESKEEYEAKVQKEAEDMFLMLHRKNEPDIDIILGTLVNSSRDHCMAINKKFRATFEADLVEKLPLRFSPAVVYALQLLMLPQPTSVARMLLDYKIATKNKADSEFVFATISRFDKDFLEQIDKAYVELSKGDGLKTYFTMLRGKLKDAVLGYMVSDTPDKKVEFELIRAMQDNGFGMSDMSWIKDEAMAMKVRELLERQVQNLSAHLKLKFAAIPLTDKHTYATTAFEKDEEAVAAAAIAEEETETPAAVARKRRSEVNEKRALVKQQSMRLRAESQKTAAASAAGALEAASEAAAAKASLEASMDTMKRTVNYLTLLFQWYDSDNAGTLNAVVFWDIVTSNKLNLAQFGFSVEEIECMEDLCDWVDNDTDNDTSTIAYEDVVVELATNIIDCAETNNIDVCEIVKDRTTKLSTTKPSQANAAAVAAAQPKTIGASLTASEPDAPVEAGGSSVQNGKIVPDLEKFMRDTFASYDVDQSGFLDINELMQMVTAMNLGTTEEDIEQLKTKWDENGDHKISWKEAEPNLIAMIKEMASDMRDHWIGLVDKESGLLFWYNIRDQSSTWMSEEDQEAYKAQTIVAPSNIEEYTGGKKRSMFD